MHVFLFRLFSFLSVLVCGWEEEEESNVCMNKACRYNDSKKGRSRYMYMYVYIGMCVYVRVFMYVCTYMRMFFEVYVCVLFSFRLLCFFVSLFLPFSFVLKSYQCSRPSSFFVSSFLFCYVLRLYQCICCFFSFFVALCLLLFFLTHMPLHAYAHKHTHMCHVHKYNTTAHIAMQAWREHVITKDSERSRGWAPVSCRESLGVNKEIWRNERKGTSKRREDIRTTKRTRNRRQNWQKIRKWIETYQSM